MNLNLNVICASNAWVLWSLAPSRPLYPNAATMPSDISPLIEASMQAVVIPGR